MAKQTIEVKGTSILIFQKKKEDFISLTNIASRFGNEPDQIIRSWLRNKDTIEFLGVWEGFHNTGFNPVEFDRVKNEAGSNKFTLSVKKWVAQTKAIGIESKAGRYGGTFAHKDIALGFCYWLSPSFQLYLIKEFQRLQQERRDGLEWDVRRILSKVNWHIHTDAVRQNQVPVIDWNTRREAIYHASEADLLNLAVFGVTAAQWRVDFPKTKGNIRDHASPEQLVVLANLQAINAELLRDKIDKHERIRKLHEIAVYQLQILTSLPTLRQLPKVEK